MMISPELARSRSGSSSTAQPLINMTVALATMVRMTLNRRWLIRSPPIARGNTASSDALREQQWDRRAQSVVTCTWAVVMPPLGARLPTVGTRARYGSTSSTTIPENGSGLGRAGGALAIGGGGGAGSGRVGRA